MCLQRSLDDLVAYNLVVDGKSTKVHSHVCGCILTSSLVTHRLQNCFLLCCFLVGFEQTRRARH